MAKNDSPVPQQHLNFFGYPYDLPLRPTERKTHPAADATLAGIATAPIGAVTGIGTGHILDKFLESRGVGGRGKFVLPAAIASGLALPAMVGTHTYKVDSLKNDMIKAYLKKHENNRGYFEDIYRSTMPKEKRASLVLLYKLAASGMSDNELNFLGNYYQKDKAKYKNLVSKYSGKENEVHQEVMKKINHPHPQNFYTEFGTRDPNANGGRSSFGGFRGSGRSSYSNPFDDMFRGSREESAEEGARRREQAYNRYRSESYESYRNSGRAEFPHNLEPEGVVGAGLGLGLAGIMAYNLHRAGQYRDKFESKNKKKPSYASS